MDKNTKFVWLEYIGTGTPPLLHLGSHRFEFAPYPQYKDKLLINVPADWSRELIGLHYKSIVEYDPNSPNEFEECMKHYAIVNRSKIARWWQEEDNLVAERKRQENEAEIKEAARQKRREELRLKREKTDSIREAQEEERKRMEAEFREEDGVTLTAE